MDVEYEIVFFICFELVYVIFFVGYGWVFVDVKCIVDCWLNDYVIFGVF